MRIVKIFAGILRSFPQQVGEWKTLRMLCICVTSGALWSPYGAKIALAVMVM